MIRVRIRFSVWLVSCYVSCCATLGCNCHGAIDVTQCTHLYNARGKLTAYRRYTSTVRRAYMDMSLAGRLSMTCSTVPNLLLTTVWVNYHTARCGSAKYRSFNYQPSVPA